MRTRLVVNADDLGLHPTLDAGILRAHREGVVTSATLLVRGENAAAAARAAAVQGLPMGVHLALCGVAPAAPVQELPTLAPGGRLRAAWPELAAAWLAGRIRLHEVERELRAQIAQARELGVEVDHLDSHQHLHLLPGIRGLVERLAAELQLPLRWPAQLPSRAAWREGPGGAVKAALLWMLGNVPGRHASTLRVRGIGVAEAGRLTEPVLLRLVDALPTGDVELGCHPGAGPIRLADDPDWSYAWADECAALCSPRVRARMREREVELVSYRQLAHR